MNDSRYRLAKQEEMHLDGNANNAEVRIMGGKRSKRQLLTRNTSVLVFLIVLLALTCIALVAFLAIEKMENTRTCSNSSGNAAQLSCTSAQCISAASSK